MKPRIRLVRFDKVALWECSVPGRGGSYGNTPAEAYQLWLDDLPF